MTDWPFKGDSPIARARKMALAYRAALEEAAPEWMAKLDEKFLSWGERWHMPTPVTYGDDDWLPTKEAAAILQISPTRLSRLRVIGRIEGKLHKDGSAKGFSYRVGDLHKLSAETRKRGELQPPTSTDRVPANGRTVPNDKS